MKDMVIQTEIKARWIILLSISSYCWSTCLLRDENMRGKKSLPCATFLHIHLVFRVQCRELWQGLMVRTCPTVPSQGAGRLGARAGAPPALALSRILHTWSCLYPSGCHHPTQGWVLAGQRGGDWEESRTKLPLLGTVTWHQRGCSRWVFVLSS